MRSFRRVTLRVAPALASVASVLLFATCDFDKISGTPTPLSQSDIDRIFSITPADTTVILGGTTTLAIAPGANVDLTGTAKVWSSSAPTVVSINSETGVATGVSIGNAIITARLIAPELDSGYSKTRALRVRYKGIKVCGVSQAQCSPASLDSIPGLNLTRAVNVFGTNNSDAVQSTAVTAALTSHDSGSTANTIAAISGSAVAARKNGTAYVVGVFESMRDSIKVKVRQVAKSLTFPTTDYIANSLNANRTLPIIMRDVADSVMTTSPRLRWASSDTSVVTIDSITGVLRVKKVDTARIFVRVDTILNKSQKLRVDQALAGLTKFAGDATSDTVARVVTVRPAVTAVDSGNVAIAGDTVVFRVGSGAGLVTDSVQITGADGRATVGSWQLGPSATAQTLIATSGNRSATFTVTGLPQRAFKLGFGVQPRPAATAASIAPAVTVLIRDSLNNLVSAATDSVFLAIANNPSAATLGGTLRTAAVAGVATFNDLALSASGSAYTLTASSSGALTSAISDAFDIYGAATKLGVIRQPLGTSAGAVLDTIQIAVQDAQGTTVANDTRNITIAIGTNPASGALSGTVTAAAVNGIATFTNLSINNAGTGYTLAASATGLTATTTNTFSVAPVGAAAKLAFTTQPGNIQSGATPTLAVTVQDANGATVTSSTAAITLALVGGTSGAAITGQTTRNAVNGVATFPAISINLTGTGYKFSASSLSLTGAESNAFNVTPGAATKLGFIAQPTHSVVSTTMSPSFTVAVQDVNGNTVTGQAPTSVTVTAQTCTGGTIAGTTSVNTASGVATFSGVTIGATQATGCTLQATATGLATASSTTFNMVAATAAIRLVFGTQPSTATAGNAIPAFTVRVVDASGTTVTTAAPGVTLSVLSGPGTIFSGGTIGATSGIATFSATQIRTAGTYKLLASSSTPGFKVDSSAAFTVTPGALAKIGFVSSPTSITAGVPFSPVVSASYQDGFGNTITSANGFIEVGVQSGPGGAQVEGTRTVEAVNGVATFPGLTLKKAFTGYTLFAAQSGGGVSISISSAFNVTAGPLASLTFTSAPTNNTAGSLFSATVQAADSVGNAVSSFNGQITLGLTGGNAAGTLIGTTTGTASGGIASFSGLSIQKAGTAYQLSASASGITTGTSSAFNVSAGTATKLGWLSHPTATFLNAPLAPGATTQPQIAVQDQFGNTNTSISGQTVRIFVNSGPSFTFKSGGTNVTQVDAFTTSGVATLPTTIGMSTVGSYTMLAQSPFIGLTQAASNSFAVAAHDVKAKLAFKTQPANGTLAVAISPAIEVSIQDAYGNTVLTATDAVTLAKGTDGAAGGGTTLSGGSATAAVAGVAAFGGISLDKTGTAFTVQASATGLTTATSSAFDVTAPGSISTLGAMIVDMTRLNNTIYWIESGASGTLKSIPVTGGSVTSYASATYANARQIANDGTNLYWSESGSGVGTGSIKRFTVATGTVTTLAGSLTNVRSEQNTFAVSGGLVFFHANSQPGTNAAIKTVSAAGGALQTPTDLFANGASTASTHYFTVSGSQVYFYDALAQKLSRIPTTGGSSTFMTDIVSNTPRLVLGSNNTLYFSEGTNIRQLPNAPTAAMLIPTTPITGISFVNHMTIEGNNLYVKTGQSVIRYDVTTFGGSVVQATLGSDALQNTPSNLLDGTYLYYVKNTGNNVIKVAK